MASFLRQGTAESGNFRGGQNFAGFSARDNPLAKASGIGLRLFRDRRKIFHLFCHGRQRTEEEK